METDLRDTQPPQTLEARPPLTVTGRTPSARPPTRYRQPEQPQGLRDRLPDAEIYASQPGLGVILGARVLGEFGDDPHRFANAKARKNYAGTSPITRASGTKRIVAARYARNDRLGDAVQQWAFSALRGSPGARAYYNTMRARKIGHQAALRQLANRLVGILHGCLKTRTLYDETTAWAHPSSAAA